MKCIEHTSFSGSRERMMGELVVDTYRLAGISVRVESLHENVHELCQAYRCDSKPGPAQMPAREIVPDLVVRTSQADIDFERGRSAATDAAAGRTARVPSDGYLETLAVYRQIAGAMPTWDTVLVHGSCVAVDGSAYLFCAPSGTGKSTHVRLWRELLGNRAMMVNDDKPLVRIEDGRAIAFGTPWNGKHRLSSDVAVPLRALCLLERAETNRIERVAPAQAHPLVLQHVYRPLDPAALALTLGLVDRLIECVDLWQLGCNLDREAAELSFSAMSGGKYL